ncbi:MAG: hypothetical protein ABI769_19265 [Pseudomonadota bacterium]
MRFGSICAVLALLAPAALAATAPVAIVLPTSFEVYSDPEARAKFGLLIGLLEGSVNKKSATQIARFNVDLDDPGFAERLVNSLSCIGAEVVSEACPAAKLLSGSATEASLQLKSLGGDRVLVIRVHPLKTDFRIRMRAIVTDIRVDAPQTPQRVLTAVYETRVPAAIEAQFKKDPAKLAAWWSEGSPSRLRTEVDAGMEQLRQMLTLLDREVPADNSAPAGWSGLPTMAALMKAGRVKCGGGGCKTQRILRDSGERLWLVTPYPQGATLYGWSIVSLDDATSGHYANIMLNVQTSDQ